MSDLRYEQEGGYWRWEHRSYPGPARRLVIDPTVRQQIRRFLSYKMCPAGNGWKGTHDRRHLVHALRADTGRPVCVSEEAVLDLDRAGVLIMHYSDIPSAEWEPLPSAGAGWPS